jgi:hypothetical protein
MPDKTWKARERKVAALLQGHRIPVTGERDGADVLTPLLAVQVKHRRSRPTYLRAWLDGILGTARKSNRTGLVVWSVHREDAANALAILRLDDFARLHHAASSNHAIAARLRRSLFDGRAPDFELVEQAIAALDAKGTVYE